MNKLRNLLILLMVFTFSFGIFQSTVLAKENEAYGFTQSEINDLSDDSLIDLIAEKVADDIPLSDIQKEFEKVGVEVSGTENSNAMTRASLSSDVKHTLYCVHRGGSLPYYLTAQVVAQKPLSTSCGTEDVISGEWKTKQASYYSNKPGTNTTYMDGSQRSKGILLFNLQDVKLTSKGKSAHCSALVKAKKGKKKIVFASRYVHTYEKNNYSWNIGGNIKYVSTGITGGLTFEVSGKPLEYSWNHYADTVVSIN